MEYIGYLIVGFVAGMLSGLLGIGGGIILVPSLVALFTWHGLPDNYLMQLATGTSLAAMIMTTLMTTWANHKRGSINWAILRFLMPGTMLGALMGVSLAKEINTNVLQIIFGVFAILLGLKLLWGQQEKASTTFTQPHPLFLFICALLVGVLSGLLGLGGGVVLIPILLWLGFSMLQASATSAACAFPTACTGAVMAVIAGWHIIDAPIMTLGFVYWPISLILGIASIVGAPLGVALAHRLPVKVVKRVFGVILLAIAARMMWPT